MVAKNSSFLPEITFYDKSSDFVQKLRCQLFSFAKIRSSFDLDHFCCSGS